jgi:hypothetical protein
MPRSLIPAYVSKYAEPLARDLPDLDLDCQHAICIPACDEGPRFLETLDSLALLEGAENALLILVVNGAEDSSEGVHAGNRAFLDWIRGVLQIPAQPLVQCGWRGLQILLVDHASPGRLLPARQGVGLARKIASDVALGLSCIGALSSPWMGCTDADVVLPGDYLSRLPAADSPFSAALYPFLHETEGAPGQQQAMRFYECFLHYYVLGMRWAGSPYAYHSIGSSFAVHMERYAAVRGFPRRLAGEDFHLLNKLVKQAPLVQVQSQPIRIRGRESDRVPFGTGRALEQIQGQSDPYRVYDPRVFDGLGTWVRALEAFAQAPSEVDLGAELSSPGLPEGLLQGCLQEQGAIAAALRLSEQAPAGAQLRGRLFEWNDALRSLRLIHLLRDAGLPSLELEEAIAQAPFTPSDASVASMTQSRMSYFASMTLP